MPYNHLQSHHLIDPNLGEVTRTLCQEKDYFHKKSELNYHNMPQHRAMANNITRLLASPSKVAHALDWKKRVGGSLLSVHLGDTSIDLATTSHPSQATAAVHRLSSIPLEFEIKNNQKVLKSYILQHISDIVQERNICGLIVSWPVQKEGWCGASCGKVLRTLDQIVQETNIVNKDRPICLWDGHHFHLHEDEWGRVPFYGVPSPNRKQVHLASQEQYKDCGMVAAGVVQDYILHHWPHLAHNLSAEECDEEVEEYRSLPAVASASSGKSKTPVVVDPRWLESIAGHAAKAALA